MAGETLSFDILARDGASRTFRSVGDEALKTSAKVDAAAASMKLFDDTVQKQGKAAATSEAAMRQHAKAANLLADAENVLGGRATKTTKLLADQGRELDRGSSGASRFAKEAESAAGSAGGLGSALGGAATPMAALVGAGVALAPVLVTVGLGAAGLAIGAAGTISPLIKAAQSAGGLQGALAKLDPEQRAAALSLLTLQGEYRKFEAALKPTVLADFSKGVGLAGHLLSDLRPVSVATGQALGGLLNRVDAEFSSGKWQSFFTWMAQNAGPDIRLLGNSFINLVDALPTLARDLQPIATGLLQVTDASTHAIGGLAKLVQIAEHPAHNTIAGEINAGIDSISNHIPAGHKSLYQLISDWLHLDSTSGKASTTVSAASKTISAQALAAQQDAAQIAALNTAWNVLVGNFASKDQVMVNTQQAFATLRASVKQSGADSFAARGNFDSYIQSISSGLTALKKAGASGQELNGYLQQQIHRLETLGPLTRTQQQELAGLRKYQDQLAQSTTSLTGAQRTMLTKIESSWLPDLQKLHALTPQVRTDVDHFGAAIVNSGTSSTATRGARQQLIKDLENAGVGANTARQFVRNLQGAIAALHGKNVNVGLTTSGSGKIIITGTGIATHVINTSTGQVSASGGHTAAPGGAAGMLVRGGTPGRDSVLVNTMPGELIVPARMVQAGAVDHLRGKIPGFAAGGLVGGPVRAENAMAAADVQVGSSAAVDLAKAAAAAARAAAAAAAAAAGGAGSSALGGDPAANAALARRMMPAWSSGANWAAWDYVEMREAGWNRFARNPGSGAYGIPQALPPTKLPFAGQAAGGSHAGPQISWMIGYMRGRYGGPIGAAAHERNFGWYDRGGYLPPGLSLAYNGTGRPEPVIPAGRSAGMTIIVKVDPVVAAATPDRKLGQHIAQHVTEAIKGGTRLYPAGTAPR